MRRVDFESEHCLQHHWLDDDDNGSGDDDAHGGRCDDADVVLVSGMVEMVANIKMEPNMCPSLS